MKRTLIIALGVALTSSGALSGCISNNPHANHTAEGAVSGTVIGAGIGALVDPRHAATGAAVGGLVGLVTGASIGNSVDRQEAAFRAHLRRDGVIVERHGNRIVLVLRSDILFDSGSADLHPGAHHMIRRAAGILHEYPASRVSVYGFTDTVGNPQANLQLSQARADAVAQELTQFGLEPGRVRAEGMGETHLRISTPENVDEPRNRRVEIVLEPYTS